MANTKSAKIANRKTIRRTEVNRGRKSRIRTFMKKVETAIIKGDHKEAMAALRTAEGEINSGVTRNLYKQNTASRKVSRLNKRVKALLHNNAAAKPAAKAKPKAASKTPKAPAKKSA